MPGGGGFNAKTGGGNEANGGIVMFNASLHVYKNPSSKHLTY